MKSHDGYIINQNRSSHIKNGKYTSEYNGCGWIATYNFLRFNGKESSIETIQKELKLFLRGLLGTSPFSIIRFLRKQGFPVERRYRMNHITFSSGIILYFTGKTFHYVAFKHHEGDLYRFVNARQGDMHDYRTLQSFKKDELKFPFAFIFGI